MSAESTKRKAKADDIATLRSKLQAVGLRVTQSRIAILQTLQVASSPLTHAEVSERVADRGLERAGLYRTLIELADVGLLTRLDVGDHARRFEVSRDGGHIHFFCNDCEKISCLFGVSVEKALSVAFKTSIKGTLSQVMLKGRCESCTAR